MLQQVALKKRISFSTLQRNYIVEGMSNNFVTIVVKWIVLLTINH